MRKAFSLSPFHELQIPKIVFSFWKNEAFLF